MNNLKLNENILLKLLDEKNFKNEVSAALNRIIDDELLKDEPDCDLIDECINAIEEIEKGDYSNVIVFAAENRNNPHLSRRMLGIIIAAAFVLSAGISAVAINRNIAKKNNKTFDKAIQLMKVWLAIQICYEDQPFTSARLEELTNLSAYQIR